MVLVCQHRQSVDLDEPRISFTLQFLQASSREVWGCIPAPGIFWGLHMSEVAQSCLTLCDPMDYSLPGFSVRGIFQAKILEQVAISFSRRSSWPRDWTWVSHTVGRCFTIWATREVQRRWVSHNTCSNMNECCIILSERSQTQKSPHSRISFL